MALMTESVVRGRDLRLRYAMRRPWESRCCLVSTAGPRAVARRLVR